MSDEYGNDFITIEDEDGTESELEVIDTLEHEGETYTLFLPADMDENDPDYGFVILHTVYEDGDELFEDVEDDELLNKVYDMFMERLYSDEDEE